ncbi:pentapeptide repeat-containing protein [Streptomyces mangrovisoli]|uniref:Oxetanocin A resistance protein n=1 Tax=Streptomyces mangrovisoli TaxID=1428628 RepID=A0A1J4P307_9ACTN|nr:pentapeptide repeat-containing protein [Streptomyces mangrovisoli]OIJ68952.1 oxetanocin A resistance protein [Streptomyces mangrovisoli]
MGEEADDADELVQARQVLRGDCARCFGLCCVALPFARSADFAVDKPAGKACAQLREDHRCGVHDRLRPLGFGGCTVYDCFGAGQHVSQVTFDGQGWRGGSRERARQMFEVFPVVRQLHELLWYLAEAVALPAAGAVRADLRRADAETRRLVHLPPGELESLDVAAHRASVNELLLRVSELTRADFRGKRRDRRGADLLGARLKGADLRGVSLRGACLVAADLTAADLRGADLTGADLRDADLTDADLTGALFVTQPQLNAARGDARTRLPESVTRPVHWATGP